MAFNAEQLTPTSPYLSTDSAPGLCLQRLVDNGAMYIPQGLNVSQFATLRALADILFPRPTLKHLAARPDASLSSLPSAARPFTPAAFDYQLGLDELNIICRTRTGYAFTELPADLQEAILSLISTRDLTSRKLDLARWLEEIRSSSLVAS